jgi:hypothetical protein
MAIFPPIPNALEIVTLLLPFTNVVLIELPIQHVIPIVVMFSLFTVSMFFGGFAEILTQRELLDAIPSRNRNSLYSLQPTILLIISTPQIAILGWLIPLIGFPATLLICSAVSLSGVFVIRYALSLEKPVVEMDDAGAVAEESLEDLAELSIDLSSETLLDDVESVVRSTPE